MHETFLAEAETEAFWPETKAFVTVRGETETEAFKAETEANDDPPC